MTLNKNALTKQKQQTNGNRACLHGGGGSQVGEVTGLGGYPASPYYLSYGHPTYHVNLIKLK